MPKEAEQNEKRAQFAREPGDPRSGNPYRSLADILSKYKVLPNGCHEWTGARNKFGYGIVCLIVNGKTTIWTAHRLQLSRKLGGIDPDKEACHSCDFRACINEDHLWEGTTRDNIRDMMAKGRANFSGLLKGGFKKGHKVRPHRRGKRGPAISRAPTDRLPGI